MQGIVGGILVLALVAAPNMRRAECRAAADRHHAAVAAVQDALRAYAACVAAIDRSGDCGGEIDAVDGAHESFAAAVNDLRACR